MASKVDSRADLDSCSKSDNNSSSRNADVDEIYPICQLLPKAETGVAEFLRKFPQYDGRGTIIAILDTGVDPAAPGLQLTTDGKHKIIDIVNCTGSGDVDTSTVKIVPATGSVIGLTGRKLMIPTNWNIPSGKVHLGLKNIYDLFPKKLKERIKKEKKEKYWDTLHRLAVADVQRQIEQFEKEHGTSVTELDLRWAKEDLVAQADTLKAIDREWDDRGAVVDCIVFHDGQTWQACVDTSCRGKLESCQVMCSYREKYQFAQFSSEDMLTYSVNIYENGNLLEIATNGCTHGTHVASIAAANFPEEPDRNGVAPGAQLLVLVVGDFRLSAVETGSAFARGINRAVELKADIINYSYGEATHWPNTGRINDVIDNAVYKKDILFVSSAGNNGPCLSTLSCPGGTSSACIGVGAYLSPEMMLTLYSMREKLPPTLFPWSARGPAADGDLGVSVSAPGGAITSVPNWTLKCSQLQNGTSMSSPHVTGILACLLSGLKAEKVRYSAISVRRAIENTAVLLSGHEYFSVGYGLVQIDKAFEYLVSNQQLLDHSARVVVNVDGKSRGIYLRELHQLQRSKEIVISVEPFFRDDTDNADKVSYNKHLMLKCEDNWIQCSQTLELMNQQRQFNIRLDPRQLKKSTAHYSEIVAYEHNRYHLGPLFRVPITIISPEVVTDASSYTLNYQNVIFEPAVPNRYFIHAPDNADWAVLKFKNQDDEKCNRFVFHVVQLLPNKCYRSTESYKVVTLSENGETTQCFQVTGGFTLELCITKWWSSLGEASCSFSISFHGLRPYNADICMLSSDGVLKLDVAARLQYEEVCPIVTLRNVCQPLRPSEAKLSALGSRDLFQDGRQSYQLILTYNFSVSKACEVTPLNPAMSDYLYENCFESQLWMIFTTHKQFMFGGEAYPSRYSGRLEKGDYILLLQLRHDDKEILDKMKELTMVIQFKLSTPINLDVYSVWNSALVANGKKFVSCVLSPGSTVSLYIASLGEDKYPKSVGSGWYFSGSLTLAKDEITKKVNQFNITYVIVEQPKRSKTALNGSNRIGKGDKTKAELCEESLRELKISWIPKLNEKEAHAMYDELLVASSDYLPLFQARLKSLMEKGVSKNRDAITDVAERIIARIDSNSLLKSMGARVDFFQETLNAKENEKKKAALIEALVANGLVTIDYILSEMEDVPLSFLKTRSVAGEKPTRSSGSTDAPLAAVVVPEVDTQSGDALSEKTNNETDDQPESSSTDQSVAVEVSEPANVKKKPTIKDADMIFMELMKFVEPWDPKVVVFCAKYAFTKKHYGRALTFIRKACEEKSSKDLDQMTVELYELLGWLHIAKAQANLILVTYPDSYRLF